MNRDTNFIIGVDIGGSHITAGLVERGTGYLVPTSLSRTPVNAHGKADEILESWSGLIARVTSRMPQKEIRVGIAMPGPFDYASGISFMIGNKKYQTLYQLNVKQLLAEQLGIPPENIGFINDAAAFLQGEVFSQGCRNDRVIGLTLGTGLGSAYYTDGGAKDADLWNTPFLEGIAEDYISGRWCTKRYFELTGINIMDVKALNEICEQSTSAKTVFKEFSANLGLFILQLIQTRPADSLVLGGNITKAAPWFLSALRTRLSRAGVNMPVSISRLGESASLIGAASIWC